MVITSLIQGGILGGVLAYLVHRLKIRSTFLAVTLGLICGLISVGLVHIGHYLYFANVEFKHLIEEDETLAPAEKAKMLQLYERNHLQFVDAILDEQTGHKGLVGFMIARSEQGFQIRRAQLTGWAVFGLWVFEALFVLFPAIGLPSAAASTPFCEDCEAWCEKRTGLPQYPPELAETLAEAVRHDDRSALDQITPNRLLVVEGPATSTTLHVCPTCEQTFADVGVETVEKNKTKTAHLVHRQRISPELAAALSASKAEAVDGPTETEPVEADEEGSEGDSMDAS